MSVEDHIRPLKHHTIGFPPMMRAGLRRMRIETTPRHVAVATRAYERLLHIIEAGLAGNVPVEREQDAADYVAHVVIDAAYLHHCIRASGYHLIGDFPYDYLADKVMPRADRSGV